MIFGFKSIQIPFFEARYFLDNNLTKNDYYINIYFINLRNKSKGGDSSCQQRKKLKKLKKSNLLTPHLIR